MISELKTSSSPFGILPNGQEIWLYTLEIEGVIKASIMNLGATLTHLFVPDRFGNMQDVVLGFDDLEGYLQKEYQDNYCYLGATIGRVGGRTKGNKFTLNGKVYDLPLNQATTHLHGGEAGWDRKVWNAEFFHDEEGIGVTFSLTCPDGEGGYPGNVDIKVSYKIDDEAALSITYEGKTDAPTILNPTNHSYFNLSGDLSTDITDHILQINSERFLPIDENSFAEGYLQEVANSPFDFRKPTLIGKALSKKDNVQLQRGSGFDHAFEVGNTEIDAILHDPKSGRTMQCITTAPAIQVYTSNYINEHFKGKNDIPYKHRAAICLETQGFPDAANREDLPSIHLNPEDKFWSQTIFKFTTSL
ncbi:aldose epimerase family protein [Belliella kenyensis]|uniref:Aldose 1-epimerase n=1 Tax=Belliella kenyensis TaxID=1472724 RepID=A0ABV8EFV8_9BACT|nr:aldose epimerase family protein [Belliella kenyensis]MCH7401024.1 galactose mutarotase [Belliella kenyensis]MDN3604022.1 aldose epimerase family protein [Belliella kenyensis]